MTGVADTVQNWDTWDFQDFLTDDRASPPDGFWLKFFPTPFYSEKKTIVFSELPVLDRRLAPFVMPHLQGRVMREPGGPGLLEFEPAYVKPKHQVTPAMSIPRRRGEQLGGSLSRQARHDLLVSDRVVSQRDMINRRWDWMAAQAVMFGEILIQGEDYAPVTINFRRDASLENVLSGTARWSQSGTYSPLDDIAEMRRRAFLLGRSPINDIVMGQQAAGRFLDFPGLKDLTDLRYRMMGEANFNTTGFRTGEPVENIGTYRLPDGGTVNFWQYKNSYVDPMDGTSYEVLDTDDVIGVGGAMTGIRAFGAIEDKRAGFIATDIFHKEWEEEDPSCYWVMSQSAPLMVPANPNNTFRLATDG